MLHRAYTSHTHLLIFTLLLGGWCLLSHLCPLCTNNTLSVMIVTLISPVKYFSEINPKIINLINVNLI